MIRAFIERRIAASERALGVEQAYLRHMLRVSRPAFFAFARVRSFGEYRKHLPIEPWHVSRIVATAAEDCGTCVQIAVNLALAAGVDPAIVRATVEGRVEALPSDLADVYRFTEAVVRPTWDEGALRDALTVRYGEAAMVEMAIGIAAVRVFPIVKRALGFAVSCQKVRVEVPG
ncbi:MAG: hypothetical protein R3F65_22765 [bacterium]|nr:hypothetical protein [Myxococcales bacterium]MCB9551103.1 hypothetical protein [Myxococcales bacterium]